MNSSMPFGTVTVDTHRLAAELSKRLAVPSVLSYLPVPTPTAPDTLSDADIRRIAVAVCDEQERRESSPLRVTAADVRRWVR